MMAETLHLFYIEWTNLDISITKYYLIILRQRVSSIFKLSQLITFTVVEAYLWNIMMFRVYVICHQAAHRLNQSKTSKVSQKYNI